KKEKISSIGAYGNYIAMNKTYFFAENILKQFGMGKEIPEFEDDKSYYFSSADDTSVKIIDPAYPFYKHTIAGNPLQPFFKPLIKNKPNLVFIILEGMGSDFLGKHAKMADFSPFLDSLSQKSLFWENTLSAGGRTFAALPSIFGSLPFLRQGFLEEGENAPKSNSLFSILNCNGYSCRYYSGSSSSFDKMDVYLKTQGVKVALDVSNFGAEYNKLQGQNGFSWGYGDKELFRKYFSIPSEASPRVSVFFTIANHSPYVIPDQEMYVKRVEKRLNEQLIVTDKKEFLSGYKTELSCMLYADDALRYFFEQYSKKPAFENTIFIITGDHRAPEIPISFQIDRFRVPLLIYSPLLKRSGHFKSVATHFDITPTLLALLSGVVYLPDGDSWLGTLLDTSRTTTFNRQVALMRNKNEFEDFIGKDYFLSGPDLYKLTDDLGLIAVENEPRKRQLQEQFAVYRAKNEKVRLSKKLLPDSVLNCRFLKNVAAEIQLSDEKE
ncbi:MAG TPA: LTA synthase family protein, partial [Bacteroidia bacterium]|nr:LTA synthase family protein [Bacteroidia bacterium]